MNSTPSSPNSGATPGASLPTALLRDGWHPHRFPDSDVVVVLPKARIAKFGDNDVLYAAFSGSKPDFTATLHKNAAFKTRRELALGFITTLAQKKGAQVVDVATYRYFADPTVKVEGSREHSFWVIGIPGAVVVVSLTRDVGVAFPPALENVRQAIPQIIGELL